MEISRILIIESVLKKEEFLFILQNKKITLFLQEEIRIEIQIYSKPKRSVSMKS